jgi:AhpD family alkylhydroperoxidase
MLHIAGFARGLAWAIFQDVNQEKTMSQEVKAFYEKYKKDYGKMQAQMPDTVKGFSALFDTVMKDGALPLKQKELIALAVGVAVRCEPCINLHVKKCLATGSTREEILEAVSVCVMMQGGPSFTYIPSVLDALEANGK